jgi:hypothetical protein
MFRAILTTAKNIPTDTAPTIRTMPPKRAEDPTRLHRHPAAAEALAAPIAITRATIAMAAAAATALASSARTFAKRLAMVPAAIALCAIAFRSAPTIASRTMGAVACPAPAGTRPMGGQATSGPTRRAHRGGATRGRPATASETTVVPDRARRRSGASAPDSARWWPVPRCS